MPFWPTYAHRRSRPAFARRSTWRWSPTLHGASFGQRRLPLVDTSRHVPVNLVRVEQSLDLADRVREVGRLGAVGLRLVDREDAVVADRGEEARVLPGLRQGHGEVVGAGGGAVLGEGPSAPVRSEAVEGGELLWHHLRADVVI